MKLTPPSRGSSQPSQADLQREAEAELRRAGALGDPRTAGPRAGDATMSRGGPPPDLDDGPSEDYDDGDGLQPWSSQVSAEEEARAITDLALQQLAERSVRPRSQPARPPVEPSFATPEEMRSRAMAEMLERQQRLARENPVAPKPQITVGARARAAPTLTAIPMVNVARPPGMPRDSGARASMAAMPTGAPERRRGILYRNAVVMDPGGALRGQPAEDPADADAGGTRPSATRREARRARARRPEESRQGNGNGTGAAQPSSWAQADAVAAASHATLSAIAVLLASMEVLPPPPLQGDEKARQFEEVTQQMRQLGTLLEQFLADSPAEI